MQTKRWHIEIEFDWEAWEELEGVNVASHVAKLIPQHIHPTMKIKAEEVNGKVGE